MSIATAITNLQGKIANAYTAIQEKGGTLPQVQNAANLSAAIVDIPSGGAGSKWGMTLDEICYVDNSGTLKLFGEVSGNVTFPGVKSITDARPMYRMFSDSPIKSASFPDLSSLETSALYETFSGCKMLSSVEFPKLETALTYSLVGTFGGCSSLTSVSFPKLSLIVGVRPLQGLFSNCTNLSSVLFPALTIISSSTSTFMRTFISTNISSLSFPELTAIISPANGGTYACFDGSFGNGNVALYFPKLTVLKKTASATTNNLQYLFSASADIKEIHFAAENQAVIEASDYFSTKWNAPANCQIFFDL